MKLLMMYLFILGFAFKASASLPLLPGEYFGGGTYRFQATGVRGPYSIHYSMKAQAEDVIEVVLDTSFSSSGAFRFSLKSDQNQVLTIKNQKGETSGEGFCLENACHLHFKVDTIAVDNTPTQADFAVTMTRVSNWELSTLGVETLGARTVFFSDRLKREVGK